MNAGSGSPVPPGRDAARRWSVAALLVPFVGTALLAGGCQRSLFAGNEPRTQFETYDVMRQRYVPLEEPDVFGNPQPALRARLSRAR